MAGVRGELPELAHHSLFFTRDWAANFEDILGTDRASTGTSVPEVASLYVSRTTATDPTAAPAGHENLFVLVPFPADVSIDGLDAHADRYLDQIGAWAGIPDLRDRVVVREVRGPADFATDFHAWRGSALGMEHTLRQSAMFRPGDASARVPNLLHAGGGTIPGVGLPMCLISAELVVKRMLGETSARPLPGAAAPGVPGVRATARRLERRQPMRFLYLGALLVSLGGLAVLDRRFRLAFWADARRAGLTVGIGVRRVPALGPRRAGPGHLRARRLAAHDRHPARPGAAGGGGVLPRPALLHRPCSSGAALERWRR